jgi:DNA-binding Xre family transcriptional regulator
MYAAESSSKAYGNTKIAQYVSKRIALLSGVKSQKQIAREVGYDRPNMLSMMKTGATKVPLEKVPALAKALGCDIGHLMRLGLEQYWPDKLDVIHEVFGRLVTGNEWKIVQVFRQETHDTDPRIDEETITKLRLILTRAA